MKVKSKAPLRIGLAGGGTDISDYSEIFGGAVLNATISLFAYCTIEENYETDEINICSVDLKINEKFDANTRYFELNGKMDLVKQTLNHLIKNKYVNSLRPFSIWTDSDAPPGTGLGSSSTMLVSIIKAFSEWLNIPLGEYDIAKMAYIIERKELNYSGGKQDQYAAAFGGFNFIEFFKNDVVVVNPLRLKSWIINELESSILLFNIGTSRLSSKIIDDQKKSILDEKKLNYFHKTKSHSIKMKQKILFGKIDEMAKLMSDCWNDKKMLSDSISNKHIENIYQTAIKSGAISGKISGAGGGGVIMLFINPKRRVNIIEKLTSIGCKNINFVFTNFGCKSWKLD